MATDKGGEVLLEPVKEKLKPPKQYKVLLLNDDYTPDYPGTSKSYQMRQSGGSISFATPAPEQERDIYDESQNTYPRDYVLA